MLLAITLESKQMWRQIIKSFTAYQIYNWEPLIGSNSMFNWNHFSKCGRFNLSVVVINLPYHNFHSFVYPNDFAFFLGGKSSSCLAISRGAQDTDVRYLKQQTSPARWRQPETWHFFRDFTAHVQHVVTWRCPEVENVAFHVATKTWVLHGFVLILLACFCAIFVPNRGKVA